MESQIIPFHIIEIQIKVFTFCKISKLVEKIKLEHHIIAKCQKHNSIKDSIHNVVYRGSYMSTHV